MAYEIYVYVSGLFENKNTLTADLKTFLGEESLRARFRSASNSVVSPNLSLGFFTVFGRGFFTVFTVASDSTSSDLRFLPFTAGFDVL
jgi:hypothetical protein